MNRAEFIRHFAIALASFMITLFPFCTVQRNLDDLMDFETPKTIYERGGDVPAQNAMVKVFDACGAADEPVAVYLTDENGQFSLSEIPDGVYNIWAEKDSCVLFQDSVVVTNSYSTLSDDTLEPPSSITGIVGLQNYHDTRSVTVQVAGIDRPAVFADGAGGFTVNGLAGGKWTLLIRSTISEYLPTEMPVEIGAGTFNSIPDTFRLYFSGIPTVSGITFSQDTFSGTMTISWKKPPYKIVRDYLIYHNPCNGIVFSKEPAYITEDTSCIDSIYFHTTTDSSDTALRCLQYRIAIRNTVPAIGAFSSTMEVPFAPKSYVTTFFSHKILYANDTIDSAWIHDSVKILLTAKNRTRPLREIIWYDPVKKDTISRWKPENSDTRLMTDTIRYAFDTIGKKVLHAIIIDKSGVERFDTIRVNMIANTLAAKASARDSVVFSTDSIYLHGEAETRFGKIARWEWKTGPDAWIGTSGPDTTIAASLFDKTITCSLAVTDEDGNRIVTGTAVRVVAVADIRILKIAVGGYHDLFLDDKANLRGRGINTDGQLGSKSTLDWIEWKTMMTDVRSMEAGQCFSLIVKNDETVWACGCNKNGQLGDGTTMTRFVPVKVLNGGLSVSSSPSHSLFLKSDGTLWACGSNQYGQLGDSTTVERHVPVRVMDGVIRMSAGGNHSLLLKSDGTLWACGANRYGQLGDGTTVDRLFPVKIMSGVKSMDAGADHSAILKTDGTLWTCGLNFAGQLGDNTTMNRSTPRQIMSGVKDVAAGDYHSAILKTDQTLWAFGENSVGQLGDSTTIGRLAPVKVMDNVRGVFAGGWHTMIIQNSGTIWICGWISFDADTYGGTESSAVPERLIPQ
jgi:alpha-tubulin suppressor-like RCC1 family protein